MTFEPSRTDRARMMKGRLKTQSEDSVTIETVQAGEPVRLSCVLCVRTGFRGAVRAGSQVSVK